MASTILSDNGVSSGTSGIKTTGSNDGTLALQTTTSGGTATTALTINTTQAIGVGSSPSYGTSGQLLTSSGSGAAPTWTTVSAPSAATPTALGTVYGSTNATNLTFIGYGAGTSNTGTYNTFIGGKDDYYGISAGGSNTSGTYNTAVGSGSLAKNVTGSNITSIGMDAGQNTTAGPNTYLGFGAGNGNSSGTNNVALGYRTLGFLGAGGACTNNVAVGDQALSYITTGIGNIGIGKNALNSISTGRYYVAIGYSALQNAELTNDGSHIGIGYQAGVNATTGYGGIFIGGNAGQTITTGGLGTYVGNGANSSSASVNAELVLCTGGGGTGKGASTAFINPNTGGCYQGNNSAAWSVASDQRLKKNIVDNTEGLDIISQIRVRNFEYRLPEEVTELEQHSAIEKTGVQLGVIAQELQQVCSDCVKTESTGVMSVDSDNVFWHMVNAIKDLKALNDTQAATITALTARIVALENKA